MALTPDEIERQTFLVAIRGYDKDEVHTFLRRVAQDLRSMLDGRVDEPDRFADLGDNVARLIRRTAEVAEETRQSVAEEADEMRARAKAEADEIREQARRDAEDTKRAAGQAAEQIRDDASQRAASIMAAAHRRRDELAEASRRVVDSLAEAERMLAEARRQVAEGNDALPGYEDGAGTY